MRPATIIIAMALAILLILPMLYIPRTESKHLKCQSMINDMYLRNTYINDNLRKGLDSLKNSSNLEHDYPQYLVENGKAVDLPPFPYFKKNLLIDPWGNSFCFEWRDKIQKINPGSPLLQVNSELVIWSKGPNGKNEYGAGDDVSRKPIVMPKTQ